MPYVQLTVRFDELDPTEYHYGAPHHCKTNRAHRILKELMLAQGEVNINMRNLWAKMSKISDRHSDWRISSQIISKLWDATSLPPTRPSGPNQPLIALCNLSPFNPYCTNDLLDLGPPPVRQYRKPPPLPLQAWCNLSPANPYDLPTMVSTILPIEGVERDS